MGVPMLSRANGLAVQQLTDDGCHVVLILFRFLVDVWRAVIALDENITSSAVCHRTLRRHAPQKGESQKFTPDIALSFARFAVVVVVVAVFGLFRCSGCCCCCSWSYTIHSVKLFFSYSALSSYF